MYRFSHRAMATVFEIRMRHDERAYAEQAAAAAFRLLDRIESELNRYDPNSDISLLNAAKPGEEIRVGFHAFQCLQKAFELYKVTYGAFDITIGGIKDIFAVDDSWWRLLRYYKAMTQPVGMNHIRLIDDRSTVVRQAPVIVDLGAIGKGYAVDCLLQLLSEWDIEEVMIHGGASSVAAHGQSWPIVLRHPVTHRLLASLELRNGAFGASGLAKGNHIIDPRTKKPSRRVLATWVTAPDAVTADAVSTALMVCSPDEAKQILAQQPKWAALIIYRKGRKEEFFRCRV